MKLLLIAAAIFLSISANASTNPLSSKSKKPGGNVDLYLKHRASGPVLPPKNINNEILYQIVVDRFANGNPANDCIYEGRYCKKQGQSFPWYKYYGGDIRGVISKLPYLKSLGVTRLWMTPIFENNPIRVEAQKFGQKIVATSYHGYWIRDWFQLNPYFTDKGFTDYEIIDELLDQADPQIKIYLDTVANHTSPADATAESLLYAESKRPLGGVNNRSHRGALFKEGSYVTSMDEDDFLAKTQTGYTPYFNRFDRKITNWNSQWEIENLQLDRLSDLSQASGKVKEYMVDAHRFWLDRFPKLAGYRMDTIKHVPIDFWREFSDRMYQSHPDAEMFGEYWAAGSGYESSHNFYKDTRLSMLDFEFREALLATLGNSNQSFERIIDVWKNDPSIVDSRDLITFIDSHDFARARGKGMSLRSMKQALALLLVSRGIPCLYYGIEQDLFVPNDPGDPFNRPMMNRFDESSDMFKFTKILIDTRKELKAIRYGMTHVVHSTKHILAFERVWGNQIVFHATSKNRRQGQDKFYMENLLMPNGDYRDRLSGKIYVVNNGKIKVELGTGDMILFGSNDRLN